MNSKRARTDTAITDPIVMNFKPPRTSKLELPIDTSITDPIVMNSKRPVKPPHARKVEQPIDENKNTSYMSIYL